jgi:SP family general alpha glucoside:H+ symporter-like MFS transporter
MKSPNREGQLWATLSAVRRYPRSFLWALFFFISLVSCGYGSLVIPSFYGVPHFVDKYGVMVDGQMDIASDWKFALLVGTPAGQIIGGLLSGWPSEKWGRKKVMFACNVAIIAFVGMQLFSGSLGMLCAANILLGCIWGAALTQSVTYASEISPLELRAVLTAFTNMAFVVGQLLADGLATSFEKRSDDWSYKGPLAFQWLFCLALLVGIPFAPESPWYLVRIGKPEKAKESLRRLSWDGVNDLDIVVDNIFKTDQLEREYQETSTYIDCFRGTNLRRTEICALSYLCQTLCGNPLTSYTVYFLQVAGLGVQESFIMGVGNMALGVFAYCVTIVALCYWGRRSIFCSGLWAMGIILLIIGVLNCAPNYNDDKGYAWGQASLLAVWSFCYQLTVGPLAFVIISEISSTKLRSRTIALSSSAQAFAAILASLAMPYMFERDTADMKGKVGFVFGATCLLCALWAFFRLPETSGRTYDEINCMFEMSVPARKFKAYNVPQLSDSGSSDGQCSEKV